MVKGALALALAGTTLAGCTSGSKTGTEASASCDRACLIKATDDYLAALIAHDPNKAPLAPSIGFVENLKAMKPGDGLWKTAGKGPNAFSIHVPDTDVQEAAWLGLIEQDKKPVLLALRLKLKDGKIVEAEHLVAPATRLENLKTVRPGLLAEVPAGERLPHDELMRIGAQYYDALDDNDGTKMPFGADCQRRENGMTTAGEGASGPPGADPSAPSAAHDCAGQLTSNAMAYIKFINNRRMIAADPVTGLAIGFSQFRHPFDNLPYKVRNSDGSVGEKNARNMPYKPFDMPAAHIFKIGPDKKVHEIEAVGFVAPYKSPTGWE